jgi:hypothetical protein
VPAGPTEATFLAAAAARGEEALAGLGGLGEAAVGLPAPAAAALGLAGLLLLVAGARRRRPIGALGGAVVGALAALAARRGLAEVALSSAGLTLAGAAGLGLLGGLAPRLFVFAAGALPGAVLGAAAPIAGSPLGGALAGGAALGALALVAAEPIAVAVASTLGAALLGGAALAGALPRAVAREVVARPFLLLAWVALVGTVGAAFQLGRSFQEGGARSAPVTPPARPGDPAARSPGSLA